LAAACGLLASCASGAAHDTEATTHAAPAPAAEAQEPLVNTLRWTTASEVSNFGFDIFRGESEDGPFERVTSSPIPGAGTVDEPQSYVWVDSDIDPTRDYWYYIESISMDSVRERFSPIIKAAAKRPVRVE